MTLADNTFAAACYDQNTIADLEAALAGEADVIDMQTWNLTESEWRSEITKAIAALRADAE